MLVRLSAAIAALYMLSGAGVAQSAANPTDPQIANIAYSAGQLDLEAAKQAISKSTNKDVRPARNFPDKSHFAASAAFDDCTVYADRGYASDPLRRELIVRGLGDGLMRRRRGRELAPAEVARNHQLSLIRRGVESLFGTMKRSYRLARCRAFTHLRNTTDLAFFCLAFNLRRWRMLTAR